MTDDGMDRARLYKDPNRRNSNELPRGVINSHGLCMPAHFTGNMAAYDLLPHYGGDSSRRILFWCLIILASLLVILAILLIAQSVGQPKGSPHSQPTAIETLNRSTNPSSDRTTTKATTASSTLLTTFTTPEPSRRSSTRRVPSSKSRPMCVDIGDDMSLCLTDTGDLQLNRADGTFCALYKREDENVRRLRMFFVNCVIKWRTSPAIVPECSMRIRLSALIRSRLPNDKAIRFYAPTFCSHQLLFGVQDESPENENALGYLYLLMNDTCTLSKEPSLRLFHYLSTFDHE